MNVDVVVIGAGPVGLACAIEVSGRGMSSVVVEKGSLVNSLVGYPTNMEFFSTPELLEIGGYPLISSHYKPLREEVIDYYRRVASLENLTINLFETVISVEGIVGQFHVTTSKDQISCRFVVVAIGFFDHPNTLGIPGGSLPKVTHYFKEPYAYVRRNVAIIGAKNSAAKAALQCHRYGAKVTMIVRGSEIGPNVKYWIRPDLINRISEGSIVAHFNSNVTSIDQNTLRFASANEEIEIENDIVLALTGYHPDYAFLRQIGIHTEADVSETPIHNQETFESNRAGVFLAGTVCGGRHTSRWFIENGRHHAAVIANQLSNYTL